MPQLVLGPLLRYVSETEATVWVESDAPCEVVVLDHSARTFEVEGHHYALVRIEGLSPGTATIRTGRRTRCPRTSIPTAARSTPCTRWRGACGASRWTHGRTSCSC